MDLKDYKYHSTFTSTAKIIVGPAHDRFLSKASLAPLKGIIPEGVDLDSPDLLYFAANLATGGMKNLNDDSISGETAIAINKSAINKFVNIGHDRSDICGCILYTGFSRFGTNEILTEAEAATLNEPFNMTVAGVIWKLAAPLLAKFIVKSDGSTDEDSTSLSWEVSFSHFDVAASTGSNVFDAKIIAEGSSDYAAYCKLLRAEGGSGRDTAGNNIFRVIKGGPDGDPIIVGCGIVEKPAAAVKGILPLEKPAPEAVEELTDAAKAHTESAAITSTIIERLLKIDESFAISSKDLGEAISRIGATAESAAIAFDTLVANVTAKNSEKSFLTHANPRVTPITTSTMKIESLDQITSQWGELRKLESAAAVTDFVKAIEDGAKEHMAKVNTANTLAEQFKASQIAAESRAKDLEASLSAIQAELQEVRANSEAAALQQKFNDRMASIADKFELDDEDTALIAADVRAINTDEAFESFSKKCDKLLAAKKKSAKPFPPKPDKKDDDKDAKDGKDDDGDEDDMKAALASVTEIPGQTTVPKVVAEIADTSLQAQMQAAFATSLKINGKTAAEVKPAAK